MERVHEFREQAGKARLEASTYAEENRELKHKMEQVLGCTLGWGVEEGGRGGRRSEHRSLCTIFRT